LSYTAKNIADLRLPIADLKTLNRS